MFMQDFSSMASKSKNLFEPFGEAQRINNNILEQISRENLALFSDNMSSYMRGMQLANKINKPEDFNRSLLSFLARMAERNFEYGRNLSKICEDGLKDYQEWLEGKIATTFDEFEGKRKSGGERKE